MVWERGQCPRAVSIRENRGSRTELWGTGGLRWGHLEAGRGTRIVQEATGADWQAGLGCREGTESDGDRHLPFYFTCTVSLELL